MKKYLEFLKSKMFLVNFTLGILTVVGLFWLIFYLMDSYTRHGETVAVPDFNGKKISELNSMIQGSKIGYEIIDSIYSDKNPPGTVIRQDPDPGTKVKEGRNIYLYVTSILPPMLTMPRLEDRSLRQAVAILETYGLKFGGSKTEDGDCNGCIMKQLYKGKRIEAGTPIEKGSVITLIVGKRGEDNAETGVPDVSGLTLSDARSKLAGYSLNVGGVVFDTGADSASAKVYRQVPGPSIENPVSVGSSVDLYLSNDPDKK